MRKFYGSVIAATVFAEHNGQEGSVSEKALGRALKTAVAEEVIDPAVLLNLNGANAQSDKVDDTTKKELIRKGNALEKLHPSLPNAVQDPNKFYNNSSDSFLVEKTDQ